MCSYQMIFPLDQTGLCRSSLVGLSCALLAWWLLTSSSRNYSLWWRIPAPKIERNHPQNPHWLFYFSKIGSIYTRAGRLLIIAYSCVLNSLAWKVSNYDQTILYLNFWCKMSRNKRWRNRLRKVNSRNFCHIDSVNNHQETVMCNAIIDNCHNSSGIFPLRVVLGNKYRISNNRAILMPLQFCCPCLQVL